MKTGKQMIKSRFRMILFLSEVGVVVAQVSLGMIGLRGLESATVFTILASLYKEGKHQHCQHTQITKQINIKNRGFQQNLIMRGIETFHIYIRRTLQLID